jgi:hypothetical protein
MQTKSSVNHSVVIKLEESVDKKKINCDDKMVVETSTKKLFKN